MGKSIGGVPLSQRDALFNEFSCGKFALILLARWFRVAMSGVRSAHTYAALR